MRVQLANYGYFVGIELCLDRGAMGNLASASTTPRLGSGVKPSARGDSAGCRLPGASIFQEVLSVLRIFVINFLIFAVMAEVVCLLITST